MEGATPHRLVTSLEERIRALEVEFHKAYWDSQVSATPEHDARREELELELRRVKGDPEALAAIEAALDGHLHEPVLARQLEVLRLSFTGNQMNDERRAELVRLSSEVESDFASYRPEIDGTKVTDNEIEEILKSSHDEELRKRAWLASKEIGPVVSGRVRELARVRNEAAHELGFSDYYRMSLELQEIEEKWLLETLNDLERLTDAPYGAWKEGLDARLRARFGVDELRPWHYADPFFQSLPTDGRVSLDTQLADASAADLAIKTFGAWGIDLTQVMEGSDLYPKDKKCQHAFCLDVDRSGKDVRILANVVEGERWIEVMLHESGHAAYDVTIDPDLPYLIRRAAHTFVTEAIAILSGRLVRDTTWLQEIAGVPPADVSSIASELRSATASQSLLFARWGLVMSYFERELYSDPESDLDATWWELVERLQLVTPPPDRKSSDWAAKIHIAVAPVYYHNYLLGEMLASQIVTSVKSECGGLAGVPEAGRWLRSNIFEKGSLVRWDALVEDATGRALSAEDLARDLTA